MGWVIVAAKIGQSKLIDGNDVEKLMPRNWAEAGWPTACYEAEQPLGGSREAQPELANVVSQNA